MARKAAPPVTTDAGPSGIGRRRAAARDESSDAYRARRAEIRDAAATLFKSGGYRGTSVGDIADALGIDRASIYYYVGGKDELLDEVVSTAVRDNVVAAEGIRDGDGAVPDKLRRLIEALMVSYADNYPFLYVFIQENLAHVADRRSAWSRQMRALNKRYENVVVGLIQDGIDDGSIRPVAHAWVMAYGLIGMVAWTNRWYTPTTSPVSAEEIGGSYADILLAGLVTTKPKTTPTRTTPTKASRNQVSGRSSSANASR